MNNREGFVELLKNEIADISLDIKFYEGEISYHDIARHAKGISRKEKRMHKHYISLSKKQIKFFRKTLKKYQQIKAEVLNLGGGFGDER
jgi:hypothetical protein